MDRKALAMKGWAALGHQLVTHVGGAAALMPDDCMFVMLLTAWLAVLATTAYILLGWIGVVTILTLASLGLGTVALQSRHSRRRHHRY
jgi:hypothetical protein